VLPTEQIRPMMKMDKIKRPIIVMSDLSCLSGCMLCSIFTGLINSSVVVFIISLSSNGSISLVVTSLVHHLALVR